MTSVQNDLVTLYLSQLRAASQWFEENLDVEDGIVTLTAMNELHEQHDFVEGVLAQMLGSKLIEVNVEPHTKRRYWRVV